MAKVDSLENAIKNVKFETAMRRIPVDFAKEFRSRGVDFVSDIRNADDMGK